MASSMNSQENQKTDDIEIGTKCSAGIHVRNLKKEFKTETGGELVFDGLDFDIESGKFVTLLGKSGTGKSTILNIVGGVIPPTEGKVWFDTEEEDEPTIGYVFQSPRLLPWNTALENIEYVHSNNPDYKEELGRRFLEMVGLSEHADKYPTQLSGGQNQRVGIARAFSIDPEILLMDEPFSNLDAITADDLRKELINIWEKFCKTVLFVTHDMEEAILLGDKMLMLGNGKIFAELDVPLERPRELDSEEFLKFRRKAIDTFNEGQESVE